TSGTAKFLKDNGIKTRVRRKISEGSEEILESIHKGYVSYVINTISESNSDDSKEHDGVKIRRCAIDNDVPVFTCLDTVDAVLDVLEEITMSVSTIDAE
ncbi:MAG: carbamoyl-phosphate synthase large subunit, partial [Bacilli bacterium]|nr:carbamoyl-phosphate synthase large subunit [Bacilli bacterium]